jgi:predicted amidohydrolase YtcJ
VGSHAIRIFVQKLEEFMAANPKMLTMDYVRNSRHGFAHGTLTGAVPDVVESMVKYNLYLPINVRRSLAIEPQNIMQNYGEPGWKFLAPIKTLIDAGVNVVGEGLIGTATPETYFDIWDVHVNREISEGTDENRMPTKEYGDGIVYLPEEGVDRVVALKLFTRRSAEFLYAESRVGTLEVGKYADFIVTDKPYLSGPDTEIRDNKVVLTVTADDIRYQDPDYKPVVSTR